MNIILFFKALKEVYLRLTKDKREAKKCIEKAERLIQHYKEILNKFDTIYKYLTEVYGELPKSQRVYYVQMTMDLLRYGFCWNFVEKDNQTYKVSSCLKYTDSYISKYTFFIDDLQDILITMKMYNKSRNYKKVIEYAETFYKVIEEFKNKYIEN